MESILKDFEKVPVVEYPNEVPANPKVSVIVQTYNHKNFIKPCLDGILSQKLLGDVEILLGEDESTDGTREICIEYAEKYPNQIKLFLHSRENNIHVNGGPTGRFSMLNNVYNASGDYLAICEGDDSWIDPYKLEKQVKFLNENPACVMVHTNFYIKHWKKRGKRNKTFPKPKYWPVFDKLVLNNSIATVTVLLRKQALTHLIEQNREYFLKWPMLDYYLWLTLAHIGKVGYLHDLTSIYNIHPNSISAFNSETRRNNFLKAGLDLKLTIIDENFSGARRENLKLLANQVYARKRFRFASERKDKITALEYFGKMNIRSKLNPVNLKKISCLIFNSPEDSGRF